MTRIKVLKKSHKLEEQYKLELEVDYQKKAHEELDSARVQAIERASIG